MSLNSAQRDLVMAISPCGASDPSPRLAVAAAMAGGLGVLDLGAGNARERRCLELAVLSCSKPLGVRVSASCTATLDDVVSVGGERIDLAVLGADSPWLHSDVYARLRVLVEVANRHEAYQAIEAGAHGLVLTGTQARDAAGDLSSYVLLQQLAADEKVRVPLWTAGGIGPHTAAACVIGGAAGVVLDTQLALMPECDLPASLIRALETGGAAAAGEGRIGEDGWLAAEFARRWRDTASAVRGIRRHILSAVEHDAAARVLAPGSALAQVRGVAIPVAQGPMTRVSDQPGFAAAVADAGALPFVALALADGARTRQLLEDTAAALGERPWGVGILGFASQDVRTRQLQVIKELKPSCVIIAGGRPAQAEALQDEGIAAFLHVPSPELLRQFLRAGSRRFVFEGSECGGHVGPSSSFSLWEAQLSVLDGFLDDQPDSAREIEVFFAGGIHDARSAAMVAAMAAPLAARGASVGILMGTAYLFTREAVATGAITAVFQEQALAAESTALLTTAPGHATRCLPSPFVAEFDKTRRELAESGIDRRQAWASLETLNLGRLRIASKGVRRDGDQLLAVDEAEQLAEGMFMAGQVAVLRDGVTTIAELHDTVSHGSQAFHTTRVTQLRDHLEVSDRPGEGERKPQPMDIAVVGMACNFPGTPDLASYWRAILDGADQVTQVPEERWNISDSYAPRLDPERPGQVSVSQWGGFLAATAFNPIEFGIPPKTLGSIDPMQLLALMAAKRALADAGYAEDEDTNRSRTGVIFAVSGGSDQSNATVLRTTLRSYVGDLPTELDEQLPDVTTDTFPGLLANVVSGRISNRLDLAGPNFTVDAACASSLAALDSACKELLQGTSDMMLCGAVDVHNGLHDYIMFSSAHALSPTGRCRTFDDSADGTVLGEGVACIVLKRLADAERDGDRIYAVIKSVGSASDGRALGLTAPRLEGQQLALERAYAGASVSPAEVGLVEAHGTGTVVGDRTELRSLTTVFERAGARAASCVLGSVKSQIGHTKSAAGLAGLIKVALSVHTGVRPPTINVTVPNQGWDAAASPFVFVERSVPWVTEPGRRYAGVSAFGFGGTNFHVVLAGHADTPAPRCTSDEWPAELFCFRGRDRPAAHRQVERLLAQLSQLDVYRRPPRLRDLAAVAAKECDAGHGAIRIAVVARDLIELETLLRRALAGQHDPKAGLIHPADLAADAPPDPGKIAFLFPGQGSQRTGALTELLVAFPEARRYLGTDQRWADLLFPPMAFDPGARRAQTARLRDTAVAQPALGAESLAVDHIFQALGIRPDMAGGHSYGELVALSVAGAFDASTLMRLSRERAASIVADADADADGDLGAMAAVNGDPRAVRVALDEAGVSDAVVVANHNSPIQTVISAPSADLDKAVEALSTAGLDTRRLDVACAFHSPVISHAARQFARVLADEPISVPGIPVWSNRTAEPIPADPESIRLELAEQLVSPVRFLEQIESMYRHGARIFVEIGPQAVLSRLVGDILRDRPHLAVACESATGQGMRGLLSAVGQLACAGVDVQLRWLFQAREVATEFAVSPSAVRPFWMVDGRSIRDHDGAYVPDGLVPTKTVEGLFTMRAERDQRREEGEPVLSQFLTATRDLIAAQRDVMLAYYGGAGTRAEPLPAAHSVVSSTVLGAETPALPTAGPADASVEAGEVVDAAPAAVRRALTAVDLQAAVVSAIAQRTGYPQDLIGPDLDLEADLSVDSIKRAEIGGQLAHELQLTAVDDEDDLQELVQARTVRDMATVLERIVRPGSSAASETDGRHVEPDVAPEPAVMPSGRAPARLTMEPTAFEQAQTMPPESLRDRRILITGDGEHAARLRDGLRSLGAIVESGRFDTPSSWPYDPHGVIVLDAVNGPAPLLPAGFAAVQQALSRHPQWFLVVCGLEAPQRAAGLAGLFRTIDKEYPDTVSRLVEIGPQSGSDATDLLIGELLSTDRQPVVTHVGGQRAVRRPQRRDLGVLAEVGAGPAGVGSAEAAALGLAADSVVVLFGGGRGITALVARTLAAAGKCRIELVGRTELAAEPEDSALDSASTLAELRAALAARGVRTPEQIDKTARAILARREVRATLAELREAGSQAEYHAVDARDTAAVQSLLRAIHSERGRIDGVVYGSGVIEDRLIADKDAQSFARVFDTKVRGARAVLGELEELACDPAFVVLFGSVAAVYGNRGQADYAAANDALESVGAEWAARTGNRCLTVHWGPWAPDAAHGGMVSVELQAEYRRRGIGLIDPDEGTASLLRELAWGDPALTSVVYDASGE